MTGYDLSRNFFDWCFENPELVRPTHIALYFFAVEHCNRLGWKEKFGFPTQMTMDAIGIKNWRTYINAFNDLVDWGFFDLKEKSKNQYSANVIAIVKNTKANTKALTKASQKHIQKQVNSTYKSIVGINKHINIEPINLETEKVDLIKKMIVEKYENHNTIFQSFNTWCDYLIKQHNVTLCENEYTYQILLDAIERVGPDKIEEAIDFSIKSTYKRIYLNENNRSRKASKRNEPNGDFSTNWEEQGK